jgi:hypothetical protein
MTIMFGQYLYSMRMLISRGSKQRDGSRSRRLFSASMYAYSNTYIDDNNNSLYNYYFESVYLYIS